MRVPAPFPFPPVLIKLPEVRRYIEEEGDKTEDEGEFTNRLRGQGYDEDLIGMGLKVAKNHMRPREEAFRIGENYIREMSR